MAMRSRLWWPSALVSLGVGGLTACVQMGPPGPPTAPGTAPNAVAPAASAAAVAASQPGVAASGAVVGAPPATPQPPAFDVLTRGAKRVEGAFPLWKKDEKVWLELTEKDFGSPLFLSPKLATGLGEGGFYGGLMASRWGNFGRPQLVSFRKVFNQVQLIALNTEVVAKEGTPQAQAVKAGYSPSLITSAPLASLPHPQRKSVLIEVGPMFTADLLGLAVQLQRHYRQSYAFDPRHSALLQARAKPEEVVFEVDGHFASANIAVPQPGAPANAPVPTVPGNVPDVRSLFMRVHYSLARLPAEPMRTRAADQRLGHFVSHVSDFSDDVLRSPKRYFINRWRLEKKDAKAALSEPLRPITYWLDRNIPTKYRPTISAAILTWNKAFEKIGFKDAIVVKQQPDNADFDTLDFGVASVRWMTNTSPSFGAIGPSHVDPRSGEILDADIGIESLSSRSIRALRSQVLAPAALVDWPALMQLTPDIAAPQATHRHAAGEACEHADFAAEQLGYALDVLAAAQGGEIEPDSPEAERFVQAYIFDTVMHEVGHTLGLRHNFRASTAYSLATLSDPAFTKTHSFSGSVMEYTPINLPPPGTALATAASPFQTTLGPYDEWAIAYAYGVFAPDQEADALAALAARSAEPELAFATDEDNFLGVDPEALQFDLGDDPVAFALRRFDIARDLIQRLETRKLDPKHDYSILRRSVAYALRDVGRSAGILARQIGGVRTLRDFPESGREPLQSVPVERQRAALDALARNILSAEGLTLSAPLQRRLAPDYLERAEALSSGDGPVVTDYVPQQVLLEIQRALLGQLMSDSVAQRLLDGLARQDGGANPLTLADLYTRLDRDIWSELSGTLVQDIVPARRDLQREHVQRVVAILMRPVSAGRAETRGLMRSRAHQLLDRINTALGKRNLSEATRSHLQDNADWLREALAARLVRTSP
ncbi:zinc-dependent metalloprotease [Leptothrix ochracea]|uniref:zinc-dependent metalloprotease n=1 Tax=Leptothrix ochracea TaxID=735331 RepID=UPI0034E26602